MKIWEWIKHSIKESINQSWTLLGMFIAWCVLTGSAKTVVGFAILFTTIVWIVFVKVENRKEDKND